MKLSRITTATICFLLAFSSFGCAQNGTLQKKYGADASYFIALNSLRENNSSQAIHNLKAAAKNGSPLIARRAMEKLPEEVQCRNELQVAANFTKHILTKKAFSFM